MDFGVRLEDTLWGVALYVLASVVAFLLFVMLAEGLRIGADWLSESRGTQAGDEAEPVVDVAKGGDSHVDGSGAFRGYEGNRYVSGWQDDVA